jgi:hypothetical protein
MTRSFLPSWPDLFRPSRFNWQSPATVIEIAGSSPAMTRLIVPAMRSAPESSSRGKNFSALRPDLRQRMPAVVAGISRSVLQATMYEERKKGSGTPNDADPYPPHLSMRRALCKARSPFGVPPRLCASGTIHPKAQPGPGFVTQRPNAAGVPPAPVALPAMHLARRS